MLEGGDSGRVMANMVNCNEALSALMCFMAANNCRGAAVAELWWQVAARYQWKMVKKKSGENLKVEKVIEIKRETCVNMDADINNYISYFQFFGSENLIIPKWLA